MAWFPRSRTAGKPLTDRIWLGPPPRRSSLDRLAHRLLERLIANPFGLRLLQMAVQKPAIRADLVLFLSDRMARAADFDQVVHEPSFREKPRGFDDLVWLFSSNWLNHRFSRLDLDEAVYVHRLVRSLPTPRVAELGRFRGGTTVLLAAAGARVLSIDAHPMQEVWSPQLERMLEHLQLRDRVQLAEGDTRRHPTGSEPYDVLLFDASATGEGVQAEIGNWWPALAVGGHAIFRDGRPKLPHLVPVAQEVERLHGKPDVSRVPDREVPGSLVHIVKTRAYSDI